MNGPTYSRAALLAFVTAATGAAAIFDGAKIHLFEDETPIGPDTDPATLTEASYGGYAASAAVVFQTGHVDPQGRAIRQVLPKEFKPTDSTATSVVRQVALMNGAGTAILASYMLDDPITFGTPDDVQLIGFPVIVTQPDTSLENIVP